MRVTSNMYYKNIYGNNNSKLSKELFDVNKQISSGLSIQYAHDDIRTFTETMRLDNEITTLSQVTKSVESGSKVSNQTDSVLNEFQTSLERVKVLLIQASNSAQSDDSMNAIADELRGLEEHFKNLSNTSINGKYIFAGSATTTKPIDENGIYKGNDVSMNVFGGSSIKQTYNLDGNNLFLGEEINVNKKITANVINNSLTAKYPNFSDTTIKGVDEAITEESTIRDLMGDNDDDLTNSYGSHFYVNGVKSNGESFQTKIDMSGNNKVSDLLNKIGDAYGNTPAVDVVNVSLNQLGEIVIEDKMKGSSKLDFHMIGASDYNIADGLVLDGVDAGDVTNIADLGVGETDFNAIVNGTSDAENSNLYIKNFVLSEQNSEFNSAAYTMDRTVVNGDNLSISSIDRDGNVKQYNIPFDTDADTTYGNLITAVEADGNFSVVKDTANNKITLTATTQGRANGSYVNTKLANDDGSSTASVSVTTAADNTSLYDKMYFSKDGSKLLSSVPQIQKDTNAFANPSTKISEVADLSKGVVGSLDGTKLNLDGLDIDGNTYSVQIDFKSTANGGSTFSLDTDGDGAYDDGSYDIFNTQSSRVAVDADEMTYQQLLDVTNMIVTTTLPATDKTSGNKAQEALDYDTAIKSSNYKGRTLLSYDGKISFEDLNSTDTKASISLYDSNAGNFSADSSVMTFNSNNALTVRDPKTDFFKELDTIIKSIENHERYPDALNGDTRNVGVENALEMIDDLQNHVGRSHAKVGAQSTALNNSLERTQLLEITTMTLRSETLDTDLAEASMNLAQLNLNYQAMLSTVGKISKLSLVNYL